MTVELQLRFDLRVPPMAKTDHATQYRACLEMVEWGERMGFQDLTLSERHNDRAGYLPAPATPGGPHIAVGGKTELAARRAARLRCHFSPSSGDPLLSAAYREECERLGYDGKVEGLGDKPMRAGFVHVSRDPESAWAEIA